MQGDIDNQVAQPEAAVVAGARVATPDLPPGSVADVVAEAGRILAGEPAVDAGSAADEGPSHRRPRRLPPWIVKGCLVQADLMALVAAMILAFALRSLIPGRDVSAAQANHLLVGLASLPLWTVVFFRYQLYTEHHVSSRLEEFRRLGHAVFAGVALVTCTAFALRTYVSRGWLVLMLPIALAAVALERDLVRRAFTALRRRGVLLRRVVVVGANAEAAELCSMFADPTLGYQVLGVIDDTAPAGFEVVPGVRVLGSTQHAPELARRVRATGALVATTAVDHDTSNRLVRRLVAAGVHVEMSFSLRDIASDRLHVRAHGRLPVLRLEPRRRHGWRAVAKRAFDLGAVALIGLLTVPLMVLAAAAVKLTSGGPVLFRQLRIGEGGEVFEILKFRTMVVNAEQLVMDLSDRNEADGPLFKIRRDPRCTRVGRLLRAYSLDELPQLWNVVRGEMSMVGPRPALPAEAERWAPALRRRLDVRPGITGMWQVSGRSLTSFDDYARLDLYYVDNWSFWTDLAILAKTVPTVVFRRGAC